MNSKRSAPLLPTQRVVEIVQSLETRGGQRLLARGPIKGQLAILVVAENHDTIARRPDTIFERRIVSAVSSVIAPRRLIFGTGSVSSAVRPRSASRLEPHPLHEGAPIRAEARNGVEANDRLCSTEG